MSLSTGEGFEPPTTIRRIGEVTRSVATPGKGRRVNLRTGLGFHYKK